MAGTTIVVLEGDETGQELELLTLLTLEQVFGGGVRVEHNFPHAEASAQTIVPVDELDAFARADRFDDPPPSRGWKLQRELDAVLGESSRLGQGGNGNNQREQCRQRNYERGTINAGLKPATLRFIVHRCGVHPSEALPEKSFFHSHRASARCEALSMFEKPFQRFPEDKRRKPLKRFSADPALLSTGLKPGVNETTFEAKPPGTVRPNFINCHMVVTVLFDGVGNVMVDCGTQTSPQVPVSKNSFPLTGGRYVKTASPRFPLTHIHNQNSH